MKKTGFTLIELIFAIVLMATIGGITSGMLGKVYENYAMQKETVRLSSNANQVITKIEKYLKRSIRSSIMFNNGNKVAGVLDVYNSGNYTPIEMVASEEMDGDEFLIWVDKDKENLQGDGPNPNYNGWINIKTSSGNTIRSVDNKFGNIINVDKNILGSLTASPSIYFVYGNNQGTPYEKFYNTTTLTTSTAIFSMDTALAINDNDFKLTTTPQELGEIYYFSYTAYALKLKNNVLSLVYDFQPWEKLTSGANIGKGETILDGKEETISNNVSSLKIWSEYSSIRIKVCLTSNQVIGIDGSGKNEYAEVCKERNL